MTNHMRNLKRAIDVLAALMLLVALAPLFVLLAIAIWVESGAPVIFRCRRFGRGGTVFTMYKFRTMALGAEDALESLGSRNVGEGMVKVANDPRVTPLGRLLRRFSLDELPQLWNVIRGEMSLVGPRPHQLGELSFEDDVNRRRLSVPPGLTGLWQIRARTNPSLAVRVRYDLDYIEHWSLLLDLRIALATTLVLLRADGGQIMRVAADNDSTRLLVPVIDVEQGRSARRSLQQPPQGSRVPQTVPQSNLSTSLVVGDAIDDVGVQIKY